MENELKEPAPRYNSMSPMEYLEMERASDTKHEYFDGFLQAMGGASKEHNWIQANIIGELHAYLKDKKCQVMPSDMRISTPSSDSYMYPDAIIICDELKMQDDKFDTLLNPAVIFEISSPSSRQIDKTRKFFFYQEIPTLREYIIIDSLKRFIHVARRQNDNSWQIDNLDDHKSFLSIRTIGFSLSLDDIYRNTGL